LSKLQKRFKKSTAPKKMASANHTKGSARFAPPLFFALDAAFLTPFFTALFPAVLTVTLPPLAPLFFFVDAAPFFVVFFLVSVVVSSLVRVDIYY